MEHDDDSGGDDDEAKFNKEKDDVWNDVVDPFVASTSITMVPSLERCLELAASDLALAVGKQLVTAIAAVVKGGVDGVVVLVVVGIAVVVPAVVVAAMALAKAAADSWSGQKGRAISPARISREPRACTRPSNRVRPSVCVRPMLRVVVVGGVGRR